MNKVLLYRGLSSMLCGSLNGREIWWRMDTCICMAESLCCACETITTLLFGCCCLVTKSCPALCDPMDCSTPGFPVLHYLPEFAQTHVPRVGDAIQLSHPCSPPSPTAFNLYQHQGLFQWVNSSHQVAKVLELQLQHQSLQWVFRIIFLFFLGLTGLTSMLSGGLSRVFFGTTIQKHQFFSVQPSLWSKSHIPSMGIPDHLTYLLRNL